MHFFHVEDRRYAQFQRLRQQAGLRHALSTRPRDVAVRDDSPSAAQDQRDARRRQMANDLRLDPARLCYCGQIHETRLEIIVAARPGGRLDGTDGVVTNVSGQPLMTLSADCPLVLVFDPRRRVVGMAHASWRCTVAAATRSLVEAMQSCFGCKPDHLLAGVGPGAGPCCYEVKQDVFAAAADLAGRERLFEKRSGRLYFDLWRANQAQLLEAGLRPENVELAGICTLCRNDLFFSYRREGAGCGHFALIAALTPP